jgi:hypothetical protein
MKKDEGNRYQSLAKQIVEDGIIFSKISIGAPYARTTARILAKDRRE